MSGYLACPVLALFSALLGVDPPSAVPPTPNPSPTRAAVPSPDQSTVTTQPPSLESTSTKAASIEIATPDPASTESAAATDEWLGPEISPVDTAEIPARLEEGERLLRLGKLDTAAVTFRSILASTPRHLRAHEGLRRVAIAAGQNAVLIETTRTLVQLYLDQGDRSRAQKRLDDLVALAPNDPARAGLERALGQSTRDQGGSKVTLWARLRSLLGMALLLGLAWLLSSHRRRIRPRIVLWGLALQMTFALIILKTAAGRWAFDGARTLINKILHFTDAGAGFLFGHLYEGVAPTPTTGPVQYLDGTTGDPVALGAVFAFHVLPTIIFFGALMAVLYHLGVMQKIIRAIAWVMVRTMGTSGSESLAVASNIFVGQTEAPLVVKPYLAAMTRSELAAVMTGGFATVSGGVLAAYVRFGIDAGHLLAASVMSAPAALVMAKIMFPETETSKTQGGAIQDVAPETANVIDAAATGASDGLKLALNVAAMLIAFMALVALLNWGLGLVGGLFGYSALSLHSIFGVLLYPLSWSFGVDTTDLLSFGHLLGTKISLNEFVAFAELGNIEHTISHRSFVIATYALCGFANFASIGIQIGGISAVAPTRRSDLARAGLKAMFAGAFASWLTACVAGLML